MKINRIWTHLLIGIALISLQTSQKLSGQNSAATGTSSQTAPRDGQHDFDFEIGTWKTHLKRLEHPLTGSTNWVDYEGTSVVHKLWNGRANLVELEVDGPGGHIEGLSLRLYHPQSREWSLHYANSNTGSLSVPTVGEFKDGRGEFFDQETLNGRTILVRNIWSDITPDSCRFEQSFSADGGKTWEVNWIANDTRVKDEAAQTGAANAQRGDDAGASKPKTEASGKAHDGQHDFDFELGTWNIHLKRLQHPLTGSNSWVEFDGTSVTRRVWNGGSEIEEFETDGASGHIEGLTLRLYNPESHQWSLYWANSKDGILAQPMIGEFKDGRGEFYDQEPFNGRAILVRYIWSKMTPSSAHFEQSFSDDGGKTWEANWVTDQTRVNNQPKAN